MRSRPRKPRPPADLSRVVGKVVAADQAHFREHLLAAGFTEEYVDDPGNRLHPDRTSSVAHALLAGLLERA